MKSWILIPSYLWKNTFKRWWENPISPLSKVLLTVILALLALLILAVSTQSKQQMLDRLKKSDAYTIYLNETIRKEEAPLRLAMASEEESLWTDRYGEERITYLIQPFISARSPQIGITPVIIYQETLPELHQYVDGRPTAWLLTKNPHKRGEQVRVSVMDHELDAKSGELPHFLAKKLGMKAAIAIPVEMGTGLLKNGYNLHLIARLDSIEEVEEFEKLSAGYYRAENRRMRSFSALKILRDIEEVSGIEEKIRYGIIVSCSGILALILGTISVLEFREERYLISLLRSFGVSRGLLFLHALFEQAVLIFGGLVITFYSWQKIYSALISKAQLFNGASPSEVTVSIQDMQTVVVFACVGLVLAVIPVAFGMRKSAGLILQ